MAKKDKEFDLEELLEDEQYSTKLDARYLEDEETEADKLLASIEEAGNKINKEEAEALEELYGDLSIQTIETLVPGVEFSKGASNVFTGIPEPEIVEVEAAPSYDYDTGEDQFDALIAEIEAENAANLADYEQIIADLETDLEQQKADLEAEIEAERVAASNIARAEEGVTNLMIEDVGETSTDGGTSAFKSRSAQYNVTPYTGLSTISSGMVNV
jgi:hypothetical protein